MRQEVADLQLSIEKGKLPRPEKQELIIQMARIVERLQLGPWSLQELNVSENRLLGLSGVEHLSDLVFLNASRNALIDLEGISKLEITGYSLPSAKSTWQD